MKYQSGIIRAFKRQMQNERPPIVGVEGDPSARFAYDLATKPPTKDVASIKAASDIFEANLREAISPDAQVEDENQLSEVWQSRSEG